ncbi:MAG: hypothetical protein M9885_12925 [Burkholderiaceae bacterium]|nr:hypothetical protein [Burkholderiaceae bacterium]
MLSRFDLPFGNARSDTRAAALIVLSFATAAALAGYMIASGRPIPILLTLGAILGFALLNALSFVVWLILVGVLLVSGPVTMFVPALEKAGWLFALLGFFLTGAAILYSSIGRDRFSRPLPAHVVMAMLLLTFGVLSMGYSEGPLTEGIRAAKRYFEFYGLLFILSVVPFPPRLVRRWWGFLVALALVQLPFAIYQRVVLVPMREGMPDVVPVDIIVGTMEGSLTGGGSSSVMAFLCTLILTFLLAAWRERIVSARRVLPILVIVFTPLMLGEVFLVFVLFPLAFLVLYGDLIREHPRRFFLTIILAVPILVALGWAYLIALTGPGQSLGSTIEAVVAYNFGTTGYYGSSLNRSSVLTYWASQHGLSDPVGLLFGHGLGSSFGGVNEPDPGHMDRAHANLFIGLTAASSVLWDLGILGFLLVVAMYLSGASRAARMVRLSAPGFDRALSRTLCAAALMLASMLFYSSAEFSVASQQVLSAFCLGSIAWLWRSLDRKHSRCRS